MLDSICVSLLGEEVASIVVSGSASPLGEEVASIAVSGSVSPLGEEVVSIVVSVSVSPLGEGVAAIVGPVSVSLDVAGVGFTTVVFDSCSWARGLTVVCFCSQLTSNAAPTTMGMYFFIDKAPGSPPKRIREKTFENEAPPGNLGSRRRSRRCAGFRLCLATGGRRIDRRVRLGFARSSRRWIHHGRIAFLFLGGGISHSRLLLLASRQQR